jgi:hypothetical protein
MAILGAVIVLLVVVLGLGAGLATYEWYHRKFWGFHLAVQAQTVSSYWTNVRP